jgi:hypothetical protein
MTFLPLTSGCLIFKIGVQDLSWDGVDDEKEGLRCEY